MTDRSQCTKLGSVLSTCLAIIVHGSDIGPSLFSSYIHDMSATGKSNSLIKFADDCSLLVPANTDVHVSAENELSNIIAWSVVNKLVSSGLISCRNLFVILWSEINR